MAVSVILKSVAAGRYITVPKQPSDIFPVVIDCTPFAQDSKGNAITISSITSATIAAGSGTPPLDLTGGNAPTIVAVGGVNVGIQFLLSGGDTTWNGTGRGYGNILTVWSNGEIKQIDLLITIANI